MATWNRSLPIVAAPGPGTVTIDPGTGDLIYTDPSGVSTPVSMGGGGAMAFQGNWNADTNSPALASGGVGGVQGDFYIVSVAGTTSIDGVSDWQIGDWIVNTGSAWVKVDNTDSVVSVNTLTGAVTIDLTNLGTGTLANLNALVTDATLIDTTDSRLSDARTPLAHATSHENGGGDEISVAGLSGELADDQPPKTHDLLSKHTVSGQTTGHVLTATSATTFAFQAAPADDPTLTVETTGINKTLVAGDEGKVIIVTGGSNVTLPDPTVVGSGWNIIIKEGSNNSNSDIVRFGSEDIDGSSTDSDLGKYEGRRVVTDGTDWWSI